MNRPVQTLPPGLNEAIEHEFGAVSDWSSLSGGMVNAAARVDTRAGTIFVKWKNEAPAGLFAAEAEGLRLLDGASPLRIPQVLFVGDPPDEGPAFLALEWIETAAAHDPAIFGRRLAEGVAALHAGNPSPSGRYGLDRDNYLGALEQVNGWMDDWPEFYREKRLREMLRLGLQDRWLSSSRARRLEGVIAKTGEILDRPNRRAELVHGDLWAGNFVCALGDQPALIDPAVHYADREVEMAFIQLFGGFPPRFADIYNAAYPLDQGFPARRPLLQLYPLLVHLRHFGEEYGPSVDAVFSLYGC